MLDAFSNEVGAAAEIEVQRLPLEAVWRPTIMCKLGLISTGPADIQVEGLWKYSTTPARDSSTPGRETDCAVWNRALFPGGTSDIKRIAVDRHRDHEDPMEITSGALGNEVVHYECSPRASPKKQHFLA